MNNVMGKEVLEQLLSSPRVTSEEYERIQQAVEVLEEISKQGKLHFSFVGLCFNEEGETYLSSHCGNMCGTMSAMINEGDEDPTYKQMLHTANRALTHGLIREGEDQANYILRVQYQDISNQLRELRKLARKGKDVITRSEYHALRVQTRHMAGAKKAIAMRIEEYNKYKQSKAAESNEQSAAEN